MLISIALTAVLASIAISASPIQIHASPYTIKETHFVPTKWERIGEAPGNHLVNLRIGLKQSRFDELERHLWEVSDPSHHRYGQHLSASEVNSLVQPSEDTLSLVHAWLLSHGISTFELSYSPAKDWISITLPVYTIEELLQTKYSVFKHEDGEFIVRTTNWSLPMHLHSHVETIQPTTSFFRPRAQAKMYHEVNGFAPGLPAVYTPPTSSDPALVCNVSLVTPLCLRTLYGTIGYTAQVPGKNKIGLNDFLGESNNRSDTKLFLEKYRPGAVTAAYGFGVVVVAGGNNEQGQENSTELANGKDLEGNLDSETILGISYPTPLTAYTTGGSPPFQPDATTPSNTNEPYLTWLTYVLAQNTSSIPQVISNSYQDDEQTVPLSYAISVCNGFAQLGARGISIIFGSGDSGVGKNGACISNDGTNSTTFLAMFPSTCPYVTSVGATKFINPEIVATDSANGFASGGGFSRYFTRPSFQDSAVEKYIGSLNGEFNGVYNQSGRAFPDLAAQGYHFTTIWNGSVTVLDGTSASTPTAAAIISLVNDALLAAGKPVLGWLNPWLYKEGWKGFTDVTVGSALGCNGTGFPAKEGWDAVTGFGTPYFPKIKEIALKSSSWGYKE